VGSSISRTIRRGKEVSGTNTYLPSENRNQRGLKREGEDQGRSLGPWGKGYPSKIEVLAFQSPSPPLLVVNHGGSIRGETGGKGKR